MSSQGFLGNANDEPCATTYLMIAKGVHASNASVQGKKLQTPESFGETRRRIEPSKVGTGEAYAAAASRYLTTWRSAVRRPLETNFQVGREYERQRYESLRQDHRQYALRRPSHRIALHGIRGGLDSCNVVAEWLVGSCECEFTAGGYSRSNQLLQSYGRWLKRLWLSV